MIQNGKDPSDKQYNVVDLASARKKQRTVQPKIKGRPNGASKNGKDAGGPQKISRKIVGVFQFVLFFGALFYFLQLCRGPN